MLGQKTKFSTVIYLLSFIVNLPHGILISCLLSGIVGSAAPDGREMDLESRGPGFDSHTGHCVVTLSKTHKFHGTG